MTDRLIEVTGEEDVLEGATDAWFWAAYLEDEEPKTSVFDLPEGYKLKKSERKSDNGWAARQQKDIDALAVLWEDKFADAAIECFEDELRELLAILEEAKKKSLKEKATVNWQWVGDKWEEILERAGLFWRDVFIPLVKGIIESQGERWAAEMGMRFAVRNMPAEDWLADYTLTFAQQINDTTKGAISEMLEVAMKEGWTIPKMQGYLETMFRCWMKDKVGAELDWYKDRLPPHRTEMIARTETMRASNAGTFELFKSWGVMTKGWQGTDDHRIRDSHRAAWKSYSRGGQPGFIPIDELFKVGSDELMFPLDPKGSPRETINCRCVLLPGLGIDYKRPMRE